MPVLASRAPRLSPRPCRHPLWNGATQTRCDVQVCMAPGRIDQASMLGTAPESEGLVVRGTNRKGEPQSERALSAILDLCGRGTSHGMVLLRGDAFCVLGSMTASTPPTFCLSWPMPSPVSLVRTFPMFPIGMPIPAAKPSNPWCQWCCWFRANVSTNCAAFRYNFAWLPAR